MLRGGVSIGRKLLRLAIFEVFEVVGALRLLEEATVAVGSAALRALFDDFRSMVGAVEEGPTGKAPSAPVVEIRMLMRGEIEGWGGSSGFTTLLDEG
jgi:hypothetical protein